MSGFDDSTISTQVAESQQTSQMIGKCPVIEVSMNDKCVKFLIDSGEQVTTITRILVIQIWSNITSKQQMMYR